MNSKNAYEVIIVGGGPAGLAAGLYAKRAGMKAVLFERGLIGGQIAVSKEVENYPGVEGITGFELAEKLERHAKSFGLPILQEEVAAVHAGNGSHSVRLASGEEYETTALILAEGGTVRKLGIPGEAEYLGRGVSYCATCDGFFFRDKVVLVVGGGDTAVEESLYLSRLARKVMLVHRGSALRASNVLQKRFAAEPIEVLWNTVLLEIKGDGSGVTSVVAKSGENGAARQIDTDGVFIFIGHVPNNQLVPPPVRMNELGYVVTDEKCETSVPGIFAIGDLRQKYANQIVVAAADGCIAGLAASRYVELKRG